MRRTFVGQMGGALVTCGVAVSGHAVNIDLVENPEDPIANLIPALLAPSSGISVVAGSENFVGRVGDGVDPNTAQSATYTNLNLVPNNLGLPTITNPDGIVLTSGVANVPNMNNGISFDENHVGVPFVATGGDADLVNILTNAAAPSTEVNDVNLLEFQFTVDPGFTSVEADLVFASDEFPDQEVTDVFAFIVDDTNFAFFQDGSLVSFVLGANAGNFNNNEVTTGNYDLEYDGISNSLHIVGILNQALSEHTIKIALADTSDQIFDSGAFIGNLTAGTSTGGGGIGPVIPEPVTATLSLMGIGALGMVLCRRRAV